MPENKIVDVKQYYYNPNNILLSEAVFDSLGEFVFEFYTYENKVKVFVREDEVTEEDDFKDLNVIQMTKGLQPSHFQIGPVPKREPMIFRGERTPL